MITNMLFYAVIAVAGYLSTFNATGQVVVERAPLDGHDRDYFMLVGAMGIILIMVAILSQGFYNSGIRVKVIAERIISSLCMMGCGLGVTSGHSAALCYYNRAEIILA